MRQTPHSLAQSAVKCRRERRAEELREKETICREREELGEKDRKRMTATNSLICQSFTPHDDDEGTNERNDDEEREDGAEARVQGKERIERT